MKIIICIILSSLLSFSLLGQKNVSVSGSGNLANRKSISQNSVDRTTRGGYLLKDGTTLFNHYSTKTGIYTIDIHKATGKIFKIRISP